MIVDHRYKMLLVGLVVFALPPFVVSAQSDGSVPSSGTPPVSSGTANTPTPATMATSAPASAVPRSTSVQSVSPATSTPRPVPSPASVTAPVPAANPTSAPSADVVQTASSSSNPLQESPDVGTNPIVWIVLAALAVLPFGYLAARLFKGKTTSEDKGDCKHCFDIKRLLDEKLQELIDLRGKLEDRLQGMAREQLREAVKGTPAEGALALAEKAETEYGRLKKLFEECMAEFERTAFKGMIIENSLSDKKILDKVEIKKTAQEGDWIIHDVLASEDTIAELSRQLIDGPWYAHFWKPGKDEIKVVFKDKIFAIKSSDKSTWADAIAHGKSIGIPEAQLDFPTE